MEGPELLEFRFRSKERKTEAPVVLRGGRLRLWYQNQGSQRIELSSSVGSAPETVARDVSGRDRSVTAARGEGGSKRSNVYCNDKPSGKILDS